MQAVFYYCMYNQEPMSHRRRQRSMQLTLPARCHQLQLNSFHIWKLFCLIIGIISEKIRKLLKTRSIIWIVMEPSCMLLSCLWRLMGSWYHSRHLITGSIQNIKELFKRNMRYPVSIVRYTMQSVSTYENCDRVCNM